MTRVLEQPKIFAMCGLAGAGKDTAANFIEEYYQAQGYKTTRIKFATALKDLIADLFSLDRNKLEGITPEDREWREQVLPEWSQKLGKEVTPRILLQIIGTDILRTHFHSNIWVDCLDMKLKSDQYKDTDIFIITDCRFPNELAWLSSIGAHVFEVKRFEPQWYLDYINENKIPENVHVSEYAWIKPLHELQTNKYEVGGLNCNIHQLQEDVIKVLENL